MRRVDDQSQIRRGAVLLLVLWMLIILGVIGMTYSASVRGQFQSAHSVRGRTEAYWAARAGIETAMSALAQLDDKTLINEKDPLFDDEKHFKDQSLGTARFSLLIPQLDAEADLRYGLVDEASRVNINDADEATLLRLPGVTREMAQSLIDWRDGDSQALPEGAEDDYYQGLTKPYFPKNAPFTSVRELLRVRGWAPLFAAARPDPWARFAQDNEKKDDGIDPRDARRLLEHLTAWSAEDGLAPDGQQMMPLASVTAEEIKRRLSSLSDAEAQAIVQYRGKNAYQSPLDLLGVTEPDQNPSGQGNPQQQNPQQGQAKKKIFDLKRVGKIIDYFTTANASSNREGGGGPGRININTAPDDVLRTIDGVGENLALAIRNERNNTPFKFPGSIVQLGDVNEESFKKIWPRIATASRRFHVISRGYELDAQAVVTIEASLARQTDRVKIIYWREW